MSSREMRGPGKRRSGAGGRERETPCSSLGISMAACLLSNQPVGIGQSLFVVCKVRGIRGSKGDHELSGAP